MEKSLLLIIILTANCPLFCQENTYKVSGKITNCKTNKPIDNVQVKIVGDDGSSVKTLSDKYGNYIFETNSIKTNHTYLISIPRPHTGICFFNTTGYSYKIDTKTNPSVYSIKQDFCVDSSDYVVYYLPDINFEKNSITKYTINPDSIDLKIFKKIVDEKPKINILINSHSSIDESNPKALCQSRAEFIKKQLIQFGIEPDRIVIEVYGNEKPFVSNDSIQKLKLPEEKNKALKRNRRIVFSLIGRNIEDEE